MTTSRVIPLSLEFRLSRCVRFPVLIAYKLKFIFNFFADIYKSHRILHVDSFLKFYNICAKNTINFFLSAIIFKRIIRRFD